MWSPWYSASEYAYGQPRIDGTADTRAFTASGWHLSALNKSRLKRLSYGSSLAYPHNAACRIKSKRCQVKRLSVILFSHFCHSEVDTSNSLFEILRQSNSVRFEKNRHDFGRIVGLQGSTRLRFREPIPWSLLWAFCAPAAHTEQERTINNDNPCQIRQQSRV